MSEEQRLIDRPKKIWNDALKMVKGEDTAQLVEQFTAEMTLVAEGLCEDQNRLRGEVNRMMNEEDRRLQQLDSRAAELETALTEHERDLDKIITELRSRLAALEKQNIQLEKESQRKKRKERNLVRDVTILIGVAAGAVILVGLALRLMRFIG